MSTAGASLRTRKSVKFRAKRKTSIERGVNATNHRCEWRLPMVHGAVLECMERWPLPPTHTYPQEPWEPSPGRRSRLRATGLQIGKIFVSCIVAQLRLKSTMNDCQQSTSPDGAGLQLYRPYTLHTSSWCSRAARPAPRQPGAPRTARDGPRSRAPPRTGQHSPRGCAGLAAAHR